MIRDTNRQGIPKDSEMKRYEMKRHWQDTTRHCKRYQKTLVIPKRLTRSKDTKRLKRYEKTQNTREKTQEIKKISIAARTQT